MSSSTPVEVDVDRERAVTVTWDDGHVSRFGLGELRNSCQCAQCRGLRQQGLTVAPVSAATQPLRIVSAEHVGNWGLNLHWSDGHRAGIYSWETLRAWCPCPGCDAQEP